MSNNSAEESAEYLYQLNTYYGCLYPVDDIDAVMEILAKYPQYAHLAGDKAEIKISSAHIFTSMNSDANATMGFLAVEEMTIGGDDFDDPSETTLIIEPSEMEKRERKYAAAVVVVGKIYEALVRGYRTRKMSVDKIKCGWFVLNCTWNPDDSTNSGDQSPRGRVNNKK